MIHFYETMTKCEEIARDVGLAFGSGAFISYNPHNFILEYPYAVLNPLLNGQSRPPTSNCQWATYRKLRKRWDVCSVFWSMVL